VKNIALKTIKVFEGEHACLGQKIFNGILNECTLFGTKDFQWDFE
jgi:hypothetical protein